VRGKHEEPDSSCQEFLRTIWARMGDGLQNGLNLSKKMTLGEWRSEAAIGKTTTGRRLKSLPLIDLEARQNLMIA